MKRMRALLKLSVALGSLTVGLASAGQEAPPPEATHQGGMAQVNSPATPNLQTGTLTGTVYCADTNLPARLATINLIQSSEYGFAMEETVTSDLEGRFALNHVQEGNYYLAAVLPGYENLMSVLTKPHLDAMSADERQRLLAQVPSVTISANQPAQLAIRLERGAEIDGTVTYDDGSPGIGLHVSFKLKANVGENSGLPQTTGEAPIYSGAGPPTTDDRGHFRIQGVLPGVYVVSVSVPAHWAESADKNRFAEMMEASMGAMDVYVGGGQRASKAETVKVTAGGASRDADIIIPLSKLHTIHGQVLLSTTGQPPPAATVQLLYADTREPARMAIAPNGEFEIHYVPEGNFILSATAIAQPLLNPDAEGDDNSGGSGGGYFRGSSFTFTLSANGGSSGGGAELPLVVTGDVEHANISVPDSQPSNQETPNNGAGQGAPSTGSGQDAPPANP
jgi:hypothetical protein